MKNRILIFSSLLCLCGANPVLASECDGDGCWFISESAVAEVQPTAQTAPGPMVLEMGPAYSAPEQMRAQMPQLIYPQPEPMRQVKLLSIKPVPTDTRPPVWDGTAAAPV